MKKILYFVFLLSIVVLTYDNREFLKDKLIKVKKDKTDIIDIVNNDYSRKDNYSFISLTDKYVVEDKQDIMNVIYTIFNAGISNFTFYCSDTYTECMNDIDEISKNRSTLSIINNYVHPYNSFSEIETTRYENKGKIDLSINHLYTNEEINKIEIKVNEIINNVTKSDMNDKDKIKAIHDYIIDNTKYDKDKSDKNITNYKSDTAYGPLFEGYGICNGYSDLMGIFLSKLNIKNIKISSENHIWNLVYLDGKWYHLDLTWDDPVMENGKDIIDYSYFLITNDELFELDDNQHYYNKDIYKEAM